MQRRNPKPGGLHRKSINEGGVRVTERNPRMDEFAAAFNQIDDVVKASAGRIDAAVEAAASQIQAIANNLSATLNSTPVETAYERQMRLMREIGNKDKAILAALAK